MTKILAQTSVSTSSKPSLSPLNPRYGSSRDRSPSPRARRNSDSSPLRRLMRDDAVADKLDHFPASLVVSHQAVKRRLEDLANMSHGQIARILLDPAAHAQMQRVAHSHDSVLILADRGNLLMALHVDDAYLDRAHKVLRADASDVLLRMSVAGERVLMVAGQGDGTPALAGPLARAQQSPSKAPPLWLVARNLGRAAAAATVHPSPLGSASARLLADVGASKHVLARSQLLAVIPQDVTALQLAVGADEQKLMKSRYGLILPEAPLSEAQLPSRPQPAPIVYGEDSRATSSWENLELARGLKKAVLMTFSPRFANVRQNIRAISHDNGLLPRLMPMSKKPIAPSRFANRNPVHLFADTPSNRALFAAQDLLAHTTLLGHHNLDQDARLSAVPAQTTGYFGGVR